MKNKKLWEEFHNYLPQNATIYMQSFTDTVYSLPYNLGMQFYV